MKSYIAKIFLSSLVVWFCTLGICWSYGGTIGPVEYTGIPPNREPTDYKNPLQTPDQPHHYHVTICNDGNWYGVWYPSEWKGNDGAVQGTPKGKNQHGYAKEEDGTGGGVQIMGNGKGGDSIEITLRKKNGDTVYLIIHVIDCSHPPTPRGRVAAAEGMSYLHFSARQSLLDATLRKYTGSARKFVPACSPVKYTTNVNCAMLVERCEKITTAESKKMGTCLRDKGKESADTICQMNGQCSNSRLLGVTETRNDCPEEGREWDVDARWTFKCVP